MTRGTSIWATPDGLDDASNRADSMGRDIPRPYPSADAPVLIADGLPSLDRAGVLAGWSAEDREGTPLAHEEVAVTFRTSSFDAMASVCG